MRVQLVLLEALAMPCELSLERGAIAHFEHYGDDPPERSFDQIGVADLFGGCEHLVQCPADIQKLRCRIGISRAGGSLAQQNVQESTDIDEMTGHICGGT